jgi:hypothetical protein
MRKVKFRLVTIAVGLFVTIGGSVTIRAQCGGGCNDGSLSGCARLTDEACTGHLTDCEWDQCTSGCAVNHYTFCVGAEYLCLFPSCTYDANC